MTARVNCQRCGHAPEAHGGQLGPVCRTPGCECAAYRTSEPVKQWAEVTPEAAPFVSIKGTTIEGRAFFGFDIKVFQDGDHWCALVGVNLMEGLAGFGKTIPAALKALAEALTEKERQ